MRSIHSLFGVATAILISVIAMTGAYLAFEPVINQFSVAQNSGLSVADIAGITVDHNPQVERIERKANGEFIIHAVSQDIPTSSVLDLQTNQLLPKEKPSELTQFFTELHRSLFLADFGRGVIGFGAFLLILISYSGLALLAKRMGGWRKIFAPAKGTHAQKRHIDVARFTLLGFLISALTGIYMSLATFGVIPSSSDETLPFPDQVAVGEKMSVAQMQGLANIPAASLRELIFPYPDDPMNVFTIRTDQGEGFIDQVTGKIIAFQPNSLWQNIYESVYVIHTGRGGIAAAAFALILGLCALAVPYLSITGMVIWWRRRKTTTRAFSNTPLSKATTVILVGSDSGSTWGFASTLHEALARHGENVHTSSMNEVTQTHFNASKIFILTSTYGDGNAPTSADKFIEKLESLKINSNTQFTVLGFGDRQFSNFCGFAHLVENQLLRKGAHFFFPLAKINQQSSSAFKVWGQYISRCLSCEIVLEHKLKRPDTKKITLEKIVGRSEETEEQTAILRFRTPRHHLNLLGHGIKFKAGDLIGILPPGSHKPRYYSIASSSEDGFVEICVKRHKFGLCSNYLLNLNVGDEIDHFIKENYNFKPAPNTKPLVMIGAGTGIAPLTGFARENAKKRPTYLFWGGRNPYVDFIYKDTLIDLTRQRKLSKSYFAFSRFANRLYVQDRLRSEAELLKRLINDGAQIMVCGGPEMASGVRAAIDGIASQLGQSTTSLQQQKRYLEDVY